MKQSLIGYFKYLLLGQSPKDLTSNEFVMAFKDPDLSLIFRPSDLRRFAIEKYEEAIDDLKKVAEQ